MQIDRMKKHLNESLNVDGDFIEFGIYKGNTFIHLINQACENNRMAIGVDSFEGLEAPTKFDRSENNQIVYPKGKFAVNDKITENNIKKHIKDNDHHKIIKGYIPKVLKNIPDKKYAFACIDLINYTPTKHTLEYIWPKMSYGGTLYFDNYFPKQNYLCSKAINEFIEDHKDEIIVSRQMMVNGTREKELAIKCLRRELKPIDWSKEKLLNRPIVIALVLKTGGIYNYKYVNNLVNAIKNNVTLPHKIVCLTDNKDKLTNKIDEIVEFKHNWPKWWGKIELFRNDLFKNEQVFYFDLDTLVVDNIDDILLYNGEFCALRDFYQLNSMGSGLMSWHGEKVFNIYNVFKEYDKKNMNKYSSEGDQAFINEHKPSIDYFQDHFPNEIVSYKAHCLKDNDNKPQLPKNAKIVCFHGNPRPHEIQNNFKKYWEQ